MYAVIKTGGKQYRVQPGDLLVVEKLDGEPGAEIRFDQVLLLGQGDDVTVGAPLVDGAAVVGTLIETRKGEKVKIFKKIRRQGYRRTKGHRQPESVIRVTGLSGAGKEATWDGQVDLTPRSVLVARARGLAPADQGSIPAAAASVDTVAETADTAAAEAPKKSKAKKAAAPEATEGGDAPAPKKTRAKKADAAPEGGEA